MVKVNWKIYILKMHLIIKSHNIQVLYCVLEPHLYEYESSPHQNE